MNVTCINSTNETNNISMNGGSNFSIDIMHIFILKFIGTEYYSEKRRVLCHENFILDLLLNKSNILNGRFFSQRQEVIITHGSDK